MKFVSSIACRVLAGRSLSKYTHHISTPVLTVAVLAPEIAQAASFEGTMQSLVNGFLRILNLLALGYLGRNIFLHIKSEPHAGRETVNVVIGIACLLSINAVWSWITGKTAN